MLLAADTAARECYHYLAAGSPPGSV